MSFTLRENRALLTLFGIWALATALATVTGPFGTLEYLTVLPRFSYWAAVAALSLGGSHLALNVQKPSTIWARGLIWAAFILCLSACVFLLNMMVFDTWHGWAQYLYLLRTVTLIVMIVHGAIWLINTVQSETTPNTQSNPIPGFLERLPIGQRGDLIRIEAQDHYLKVVTDKGASLILLRLSEAVTELGSAAGLQIHRSHWVALNAVMDHRRVQGRDLLVMSDGAEIPVSRSYREAARSARLF